MYDPQHLVVIEYPHTWASDRTVRFTDLEEARDYAVKSARGKSGQEDYARVSMYTLIQTIN